MPISTRSDYNNHLPKKSSFHTVNLILQLVAGHKERFENDYGRRNASMRDHAQSLN